MAGIEHIIDKKISIEEKEYYIIREKNTQNLYQIPVNQIEVFEGIELRKTYKFIKNYNERDKKTYLSIIHPKYNIGETIHLKILEKFFENEKHYYRLESEFKKPLQVLALDWQKNIDMVKCLIVGYKRGIPQLRNIDTQNSEWIIGETINLKIKRFDSIKSKGNEIIDTLVVDINNNQELHVWTRQWHTKSLWKHNDIKCRIKGISRDGLPKLVIDDNRHPFLEEKKIYPFIIKAFSDKVLKSGTLIKIIQLKDRQGHKYEVQALPNQENRLKENDTIECEIVEISTRIQLKQVNIGDPYYYSFEDVINDKALKKKYFDHYLNDSYEANIKLKSQYDQKSAFWILTYCNVILTQVKQDASKRKNLNDLNEVIDLHTKLEEWILKKGILKSIKNDEERKLTKAKALQIIENNKSEKYVIDALINFQHKEFFEGQEKEVNFEQIFYFIKHSYFKNIDEIKFLKFIMKISKNLEINPTKFFFIKKLMVFIQRSRINFKDSLYQDYFILSQNLKIDERKKITKFINWIFIELILARLIGSIERGNVLLSNFYRLNTYLFNDLSLNQKLLLNAFYVISNPEKEFELPIRLEENSIKILAEQLSDNPNLIEKSININKEYYTAKITEKHYQGFKIYINDNPGFLPTQNIFDNELKYCENQIINWDTNVEIILHCPKFNYFVAKQLDNTSKLFLSKNNFSNKNPTKDKIIFGTVKDTTEYGVFLSTGYGDGLLHLNNIANFFFDKNKISKLFKKGDKIPVMILSQRKAKLELSLKRLIGTEYEKNYYDILKFYEVDDSDDDSVENRNLNYQLELEKGFIFEQYATIQSSITEKIRYIKFAKAFFSNTKNARSYLLNIYIEYFNSLIKLDELIENYSFEKYDSFRNDIIHIKSKVQLKTLENFPESKNLLFFIDILNLFNSQDENHIEELFNLTKKPIEENDILLKAVAKNALANNLIITEISKDDSVELNEFTLKNLLRIREYISQGVLSIKETVEDKLTKELNQKRTFWRNKINEDEGEKLEFKATFITPVPTNEKKRIIAGLQKQLQKQKNPITIETLTKKIEELNQISKNIQGIEKKIIHSALKTICAFANTNGGYLLLGVSDDKKIFGLEKDYDSFKQDEKNRDGFGKYFDEMIKSYFGDSFSSSHLEKEFLKFPEGDILIVLVKKSAEEVFILKNEKGIKEENIYVRNLSSSYKLKGIELSKFIKNRYRQQINRISSDIN